MDAEVIIAGGGPTGLFLGNLLGSHGVRTVIFEQGMESPRTSRAIGVAPPSLGVMRQCGLDMALIQAGVPVRGAVIHGTKRLLGRLDFAHIAGNYPFILAVPQYDVEKLLRDNLKEYPFVTLTAGVSVASASEDRDRVHVLCKESGKGSVASYSAALLCLCEGDKGYLRQTFGCNTGPLRYRDTFLMADFRHDSGLGTDAHLFFTRYGAVESFPLPGGQRRWVVQTDHFMEKPPTGFLEMQVLERTGFKLCGEDMIWQSPFGTKRRIEKHYFRGRVLLAGDAAHVMPPIGGQGMNTGFMDACFLAQAIMRMREASAGQRNGEWICAYYESMRRRAAASAARRARFSMYVGTRKRMLPSLLRNLVIGLALHTPVSRLLAPHFAMLTIPYGAPEKDRRKLLFT